jgi:hypothetical protein
VVPPEGLAVRVIDCPTSMAGDDGVIGPAASVGFTVTGSAGEHCDADAESVTL